MTDEQIKEYIVEEYDKITQILSLVEKIESNNTINLVPEERIKIPHNRIDTVADIEKKYHLDIIIKSKILRKNIAYTFQEIHLLFFLFKSFYLWGPVKILFLKNVLISYMSIFEAVVLECSNSICDSPSVCNKSEKCPTHFNKSQRNNTYEALIKLNELGVTNFSYDEMEEINKFIELRNNIHIRLDGENEYLEVKYKREYCKNAQRYVKRLCNCIYQNAKKYYFPCG
ncbi:MAG: hypothetical protein ACI4JT_10475 [Oscillospiraceae bacterium]